MCDIDPVHYVEALRILINASSQPGGPSYDEAISLLEHLPIPEEWVRCLLSGWQDYAKRYKKPLFPELIRKGNVRFLAPRMLRVLARTKEKLKCRLCGLPVQKPAICWHKTCWKALEPQTGQGWREVCTLAFDKCGGRCEHCQSSLRASKRDKKKPKPQYDHIIALCLGGEHSANNIQVLCVDCHKTKTKTDKGALAKKRKEEKEAANAQNILGAKESS